MGNRSLDDAEIRSRGAIRTEPTTHTVTPPPPGMGKSTSRSSVLVTFKVLRQAERRKGHRWYDEKLHAVTTGVCEMPQLTLGKRCQETAALAQPIDRSSRPNAGGAPHRYW